jgi:mannitol-1-phosphate/altronate dehydrogenase
MDRDKKYYVLLVGFATTLATLIFGFFLLWNKIADQREYVYLSAEASQGSTAGGQATPVVATIRMPDEGALRTSIREVLRQELQTYRQTVASDTTQKISTAETPQVVENTTTNLQALSNSSNVVSGALARRVWTHEDSLALIQRANQLTRAQRDEILQEIVGAINRQELTPMDIPPGL